MKEAISYKNIAPFLVSDEKKISRWISYAGLCLGMMLLLASVQMYVNVNDVLKQKDPKKGAADYVAVTKMITNENLGRHNGFSPEEIGKLKEKNFISDVAPMMSNRFKVTVSAGDVIPFTTDLFLESIKPDFIDTVPAAFAWKPGDLEVPIIFPSDFLDMYNVFAPAEGLPQVSSTTLSSINFILDCYGENGRIMFKGHVVGLSDRINSILVPATFLDWANNKLSPAVQKDITRLYIKTEDVNNPELIKFMEQSNYRVNKETTKAGRIKFILDSVIAGLATFAVMVIILSLLLFSFYLKLMIARSRDNLQLLLTLGYSPGWLSKTVAGRGIFTYIIIVIVALIITALIQYMVSQQFFTSGNRLSTFPHPIVYALVGIILALAIWFNYHVIRNSLFKL
jgi:hypothetical protein